jgi:glycyl-tRNA synthetase
LNASITKQGAEVRTLKKEGGSADSIAEAVAKLQALKIEHAEKSKLLAPTEAFNRRFFDDLILRKMFVVGAFEIHGGVKGLYDLGPPACALKVRTSSQLSPLGRLTIIALCLNHSLFRLP